MRGVGILAPGVFEAGAVSSANRSRQRSRLHCRPACNETRSICGDLRTCDRHARCFASSAARHKSQLSSCCFSVNSSLPTRARWINVFFPDLQRARDFGAYSNFCDLGLKQRKLLSLATACALRFRRELRRLSPRACRAFSIL